MKKEKIEVVDIDYADIEFFRKSNVSLEMYIDGYYIDTFLINYEENKNNIFTGEYIEEHLMRQVMDEDIKLSLLDEDIFRIYTKIIYMYLLKRVFCGNQKMALYYYSEYELEDYYLDEEKENIEIVRSIKEDILSIFRKKLENFLDYEI